ncbi:hypothetical protein A1O3_01003 [Capronia epimyces CBS 606.96]|uniref:Uncharacterized protein n=1 Tax=Capronia epimyces CBS 606.96 TaxID=1182542 RepID=W9YHU8_9EURO|nr:uncharacterized protein A1O3_01003 [Capronia epimyces CBS 606.96]EXJ92452.1 hypothetical protein A1O3_01003 [Capronia epimyces CBS 606.96]
MSQSNSQNMLPKIKATPENKGQVIHLRTEALNRLRANKLYVALYLRSDPHIEDNFHWAFYHHASLGKTIHHIKNLGSGWTAEHAARTNVFISNLLCVVIEIASIPTHREQELATIMRTYDNNLNDIPGIRCRLWIFLVLKLLVQQGLVHCDNLETLQQECLRIGNEHSQEAIDNYQPRPVLIAESSS